MEVSLSILNASWYLCSIDRYHIPITQVPGIPDEAMAPGS